MSIAVETIRYRLEKKNGLFGNKEYNPTQICSEILQSSKKEV